METTTSPCCSAAPAGANFCPTCGTQLARATDDLQAVLDRLHLHAGHDYRERVVRADGTLDGVRMLGVSATTVEWMRAALPGFDFVERSRRPGVGDPADWLRVDVIRR